MKDNRNGKKDVQRNKEYQSDCLLYKHTSWMLRIRDKDLFHSTSNINQHVKKSHPINDQQWNKAQTVQLGMWIVEERARIFDCLISANWSVEMIQIYDADDLENGRGIIALVNPKEQ